MSADNSVRKVLHIIHGFGPGGVETWLRETVNYLYKHPELNLQFDFLLTGGVLGIFDQEIKSLGSRIFYSRYSNKSIFKFRSDFRDILKKNNYLAVHDHQDFVSGWHYLLGGRFLPKTRIAHVHNTYSFVDNYVVNSARRFSFKIGRRLMAMKATKITGTSDAVMNEYGYHLSPFNKKRVAPAYCGFDTTRFRYDEKAKAEICKEVGWDHSVKIGLFVGRLSLNTNDTIKNQKNPGYALQIAKELVTRHNDWRFLFVGHKGEVGEQMESEINSMQLGDRIKFLNVRTDIPQLMSSSDVLIFPSSGEGMGMVVVEAQCSGLRVVMSDKVPAESIVCPEMVTVKSTGIDPVLWADAISGNSSLVDRKCYAQKIWRSPFSIENSVSRLIGLYES